MIKPTSRLRLAILLACAAGSAVGADALIPIDAGTYVVSSYLPCAEAPLAGVVSFTGTAFAGPHESNCRSVVLGHEATAYRIETECRAEGDGSPSRLSRQTSTVRVESRSRFVLTHDGSSVEYALCPSFR